MAQLVLDGITPSIFQEIERRARQAGTSVQAEASRLLEAALALVPADDPSGATDPESAVKLASPLADRQAALAAQYPDEYVVLRGEHLLVHTPDKDEAFAGYEAALEQGGGEEPILIPSGARRRIPRPVVRGRSSVRTLTTRRR